jgi:hypothetical protein
MANSGLYLAPAAVAAFAKGCVSRAPCFAFVRNDNNRNGVGNKNRERAMTDHNHFFVLLGRDISALLGIAEYLEMLGRDRVANLVRTVTFSIEQTVNDLRHDLLHLPRCNKPKLTARRVRRKRASDLIAKRAQAPAPRPKPIQPIAESTHTSPRVST